VLLSAIYELQQHIPMFHSQPSLQRLLKYPHYWWSQLFNSCTAYSSLKYGFQNCGSWKSGVTVTVGKFYV